ncbi:hypothetical protein EHW67_12570 [Arenibacter aquaticus]|uniref:DUF922 domain-containing protein n=1 Tax=Arenibacter aquaticus TaxID=2489054 RepID=A0A3S0ADG7_9FLAO|nr:hypothetical protein [Arenibacter aquaticus]RTE53011.1 hypothetical protein EHW67_12570 [Arenibacter aquaticus]
MSCCTTGLVLAVILTACSTSTIIVKEFKESPLSNKTAPNPTFVITTDDPNIRDSLMLGTIKTKHNTGDCNFRQVKHAAKSEAMKIGGNLLVITEHKLPNTLLNPCHRLKGNIYWVSKPEIYEKEILWSSKRKLEIGDFKASTKEKEFIAATNSYFGYTTSIQSKENMVVVEVDTYFDCESSYFKKNQNQAMVLDHEQLHFDITELYARKFVKRLHNEIVNFQDLVKNAERIGDEVNKELQSKQQEYDAAVYKDLSKQSFWNEWTATALKKLAPYKTKKLNKPYK